MLHVEDDDAAAQLFEIAIQETDLPIRFSRFRNGEEALAYLRNLAEQQPSEMPQLVFLDLSLPGKHGLEVLSEMRQDASLSSIPVVILTSSVLAIDRSRSLALGAREYIVKPSTFQGYMDVVRDTCSRPFDKNA